jgi:hypothetical protein
MGSSRSERENHVVLERLAGFLYRRRRFVLVFAVLVVVLGGVFGGPVFGALDSSGDFEVQRRLRGSGW